MSTPERPPNAPPPAPSGASPPRSRFRVSRGWILFGLALPGLQHLLQLARDRAVLARPRPVQPVLPQAGDAGHVKEITSKGTAIQGTFGQKRAVSRARSRRRSSGPRCRPSPTTTRSRQLLEKKGVVVNAQPLDTGVAVVAEPAARLRADAPVPRAALLADRAGRGTCRTSSARSAARAHAATRPRATGSRSPTSPGSTRRRPS